MFLLNTKKLAELLKKYPKAYIYYIDAGKWIIYTSKPDFDREYNGEGNFEKFEIAKGHDRENLNGHVPMLVDVLALIAGYQTDSV
jgi:hypothetical protein